MRKVAFICLGSYSIKNWSTEQNFDRQSVYSIALSQALRIAEDTSLVEKKLQVDLYIIENTIEHRDQIIEELNVQLQHEHIKDVLFINNNGVGSKSKGAGEYMMCAAVIEKHKKDLETYDWIVYYTLRQTIISPLILSAMSKITDNKINAIVGNPFFLRLDGKRTSSAPGHYCDMIFAMKPKKFFSYIQSMSPEELIAKNISSERNLFNFIDTGKKNNEIFPLELERLGVMRYDYAINRTEII